MLTKAGCPAGRSRHSHSYCVIVLARPRLHPWCIFHIFYPPRIPLPVTKMQLDPPSFKVILTHTSCLRSFDPSSSLFCSRILLTLRPGCGVVPGQRPAVGEGEPDGEDGRVGAVGYAWGSRVRCSSDGHGMGTRGVAATVLRRRWGFKYWTHVWRRTALLKISNKNHEMGLKGLAVLMPNRLSQLNHKELLLTSLRMCVCLCVFQKKKRILDMSVSDNQTSCKRFH